jgi:CHAT domain-containing protein
MFCLIVKGDIDAESDHEAMRRDWEDVQSLARDLHDSKWENRALGQIGVAEFYAGDVQKAESDVWKAWATAKQTEDVGGQILYSSVIGNGLAELGQFAEALPWFERAVKLTAATSGAGYPFVAYQGQIKVLIGLRRFDDARQSADAMLAFARKGNGRSLEAAVLVLESRIADAAANYGETVSDLEESVSLCKSDGLLQQLSEAQSLLADAYRKHGDLKNAEQLARDAEHTAEAIGELWSVPQRLQKVAQLQVVLGEYAAADQDYDRAAGYIDAMVGRTGALLDRTALVKTASEMYTQHFALLADKFGNAAKAYAVLEQVRGRVMTDSLMSGLTPSFAAKRTEHEISELQLKLITARSNAEVRRIGEEILVAEESRWVNPEFSILKSQSQRRVTLATFRRNLDASTAILEFVLADPRAYCLVITRDGERIVSLTTSHRIEQMVAGFLTGVKDKQAALAESRDLYEALLRPIPEAANKERLVVVRDGALHALPFDALMNRANRYVVENHTVVYAPSATTYYLLTAGSRPRPAFRKTLLAVGAVPYDRVRLVQTGLNGGYHRTGLSDLPGSRDEVLSAQAMVGSADSEVLMGSNATESAFKAADLAQYRIIHLAVHGIANTSDPQRSALVLLSDPAAGEDGLLQAAEIVQLRLRADLVLLSACDTAVGPVEGEEGIATLSRAFLLSGARSVISTLWRVDETSSPFLIQRFYAHLVMGESVATALAAAKRDFLHRLGHDSSPYYWAEFTLEGAGSDAIRLQGERPRTINAPERKVARENSLAH